MRQKYTSGFTLIEMLVTVVILSIVLAVAVPSFYSMIQNNRSVTTTNNLIFGLKLARSEAIKRGVSVSVCPTANSNFTACGTDWTQGWFVFVNPDENSIFANNANEVLIRSEQLTGTNYQITPSPNVNLLTYKSSGFVAAGTGNVTFAIYSQGCKTDHARSLNISTTGRTSVINTNCP
jgi:type IV fimbrial biogenesis protein FimT